MQFTRQIIPTIRQKVSCREIVEIEANHDAYSTGLVQAWLPSLGRHDKGTNFDLNCSFG